MTNASPIEILYTLCVLIGVACNAWCLRESIIDRRAVVSKADCSEMAWLIANGNVRAEWVRLLVQVSFSAIGIMSLLVPPANNDPHDRPLLMAYIICVRLTFFIASVGLVVNSVLNVRERRRILHLSDSRHFHRRQSDEDPDPRAS